MIVPVSVPVVTADGKGATTDANGNFSSVTLIHPANWAAVRLLGTTTGSGTWVLNGDNNLPLDFANGAQASTGQVLVAPGQRLNLSLVGAAPGLPVLAQYVGVMSADLNEVLPFYRASANPAAAQSMPPPTVQLFPLGATNPAPGNPSFQIVQPATLTSVNFNLPVGVKAVRIAASVGQGGPAFTYSMVVSEQGSGIVLWPQGSAQPGVKAAPLFPGRPVLVPFDSAFYTVAPFQVNVSVTGDPTASLNFWVSALFDVESVDVWSQMPLTVAASGGTFTVQEGAAPPLWQAPRARAYLEDSAAAGPFTLVAGVANQVIRVFGWDITLSTAGFASMYDGSLAATAGRFATAHALSAAGIGSVSGYHAGMPLTSGAALTVDKDAAATSARWAVSYSQG